MTTARSRVPAIPINELTGAQKDLIGAWTELNYSRVVINHPDLYAVYIPFLEQLIARSVLTPRDRELVVLRTLALCREDYELDHHKTISRNAELTEPEIAAACAGEGSELNDHDLLVLKAVDELVADQVMQDVTWDALAKSYSQQQLMELVFLTGCYVMMAMTTKSFGVELESSEEQSRINSVREYT